MRAILLAAGLGTRLAPLRLSVPKILVPVAGRPLLEHQLRYLARAGVDEVVVNVHGHAGLVEAFLIASTPPVPVRLSVEPELLGTAGALEPLRDLVTGPTIVLYGDVLTDADLRALVAAHPEDAAATLAYHEPAALEGKGLLELADDGRVTAFVEKPDPVPARGYVNAGLHVVTPAVLPYVGPGLDLAHDVWPAMLTAGERLYGYRLDGYVQDVGSPAGLDRASSDLAAGTLRW